VKVLAAVFWGFVGGAALLVGALLGIYVGASQRVSSVVMAVGSGVLISSVAFELMEEAYRRGGFDTPAIGLLSGAVIYFAADWAAGAILTTLASTMLPEAYEEGGAVVGVVTPVGFLAAFVLSHLE
jgi:zinc transporter ZupT